MTIGLSVCELHLSEARSLKEKRMVLNRLKGRLKRFNVSVAEVEHQDTWQRAALAIVCVSSSRNVVEELLRSSAAAIEHEFVGEVLNISTEFLT